VVQGRMSLNRFVELTSTAAAKTFGMFPKKGTIAVGSDADVVVFNPNRKETISVNNPFTHHMRVDYSAYEGFEVNPDGSYNLLFGYMNQNWLEEPDIPVGPDNYFSFTSPGGLDDLEVHAYDAATADMGQPKHFLPRRNRFTFKVRIPAELGDRELVWTLRTQGTTRRAFATMRQDLLVDNMVIASETGSLGAGSSSPEVRSNVGPMIDLEMDRVIEARVGQPVRLVARVTDDGLPRSARGGGRGGAGAQGAPAGGAPTAAATPPAAATPSAAGPGQAPADAGEPEEEEEEVSPEVRALQRALNEPSRITVNKVNGLHFMWFVYRGEDHASFQPIQIK